MKKTCTICGKNILNPSNNAKHCPPCRVKQRRARSREHRHANLVEYRAVAADWYARNRMRNPEWQEENKRRARLWREMNRAWVREYNATRR